MMDAMEMILLSSGGRSLVFKYCSENREITPEDIT